MPFVADTPAAPTKGRFVPDAPAPQSIGDRLLGGAEIAGAGVGNIVPGILNGANDIAHRLFGVSSHANDVPTFHVGQEGQRLTQDVMHGLNIGGVAGPSETPEAQAEAARNWQGRETFPDPFSPSTRDTIDNVAGHVGQVAQDVAGIAPLGGLLGLPARTAAGGIARDAIEDQLHNVGYRNLPRQGGGSLPARVGTTIIGEPSAAQGHTLSNQATTDVLAKNAAGVPQDVHATAGANGTLAAARANGPGKVYDAARASLPPTLTQDEALQNGLAGIGDTTSQLPRSPDVDALKQHMLAQPQMSKDQLFANVQEAREKASRFYNSDSPDAHAIADAYQQIANEYESFIGRSLPSNGPVSLADWQAARKAFAKNYAVEGATVGTSVDAAKLARIQNKDPDLLDGELQLIATQHNRYPLSTGFGPRTFAPGGEVGTSGSLAGSAARHITGPAIGAAVGSAIGGVPGALAGGAVGQVGASAFNSLIRRVLTGSPGASRATAIEALSKNPDLMDFLNPPGPHQYERLPPFPSGELSLADDFQPRAPQPNSDVGAIMSHGVGEPPAPGLTSGPMGAPAAEGVPFTRSPDSIGLRPTRSGRNINEVAPSHIIGLEGEPVATGMEPKTNVGDRFSPTIDQLLEDLSHHPDVMSQGVPEGIVQRTPKKGGTPDLIDVLGNNASGESAASMEAINRGKIEAAEGRDRFLVDQDGKMWPIRGVEAADATAPKGSIIIQKGVGATPYTILDRGGLPSRNAQGLLNRALAGGEGRTLADLLGG
jgi:hypothetical protein